MTVEAPDADAVAPPRTIIDDELLREIAVSINPFVAIGQSPATNLRAQGFLADVVEKHGWDEASVKFPEITAFLGRLRSTLDIVVAGVQMG